MLAVAPALEFYIRTDARYLLLLLLVSLLERGSLGSLLILGGGVVSVIELCARILYMKGFIRRAVEEITVVRDDYDRLFVV